MTCAVLTLTLWVTVDESSPTATSASISSIPETRSDNPTTQSASSQSTSIMPPATHTTLGGLPTTSTSKPTMQPTSPQSSSSVVATPSSSRVSLIQQLPTERVFMEPDTPFISQRTTYNSNDCGPFIGSIKRVFMDPDTPFISQRTTYNSNDCANYNSNDCGPSIESIERIFMDLDTPSIQHRDDPLFIKRDFCLIQQLPTERVFMDPDTPFVCQRANYVFNECGTSATE
ncbi:hypothetical protein N7512_006216 [Penicillium capsulatum]|nr:hypothetical protein N7512_006216 [Penicillium capsulatum]